ncbi:hypothetical protein PHSY_000698 [Pseudozyma hubeiensis SY62]|uniref:Uncharacterized protein n=1 Tax=Pseudozyma hubeiensis (strain SY62) TaxID=1305764 RepID=R9P4U4_PSEHS|nr:hypothetical protein PHSY_000698 [Pseudozyma hubeiensis SY62]GAC93135.1 hypothetical protein PHSY_000698 [Pseudozyma hubeiensis SY62]
MHGRYLDCRSGSREALRTRQRAVREWESVGEVGETTLRIRTVSRTSIRLVDAEESFLALSDFGEISNQRGTSRLRWMQCVKVRKDIPLNISHIAPRRVSRGRRFAEFPGLTNQAAQGRFCGPHPLPGLNQSFKDRTKPDGEMLAGSLRRWSLLHGVTLTNRLKAAFGRRPMISP